MLIFPNPANIIPNPIVSFILWHTTSIRYMREQRKHFPPPQHETNIYTEHHGEASTSSLPTTRAGCLVLFSRHYLLCPAYTHGGCKEQSSKELRKRYFISARPHELRTGGGGVGFSPHNSEELGVYNSLCSRLSIST